MNDVCRQCPHHCVEMSDADLRAEANRRGFELHHKGFSVSMQNEIRACVKLQQDAKALEERIHATLAKIARTA